MKKIIGIVLLAFLVFAGYKSYVYYSETYKSETAYAKTPVETPPLEKAIGDDGKQMWNWQEYSYELSFVTASGKTIKLPYSAQSERPTPLEPNSYVKAEVSQKRITSGPTVVDQSEVPKDILDKLN